MTLQNRGASSRALRGARTVFVAATLLVGSSGCSADATSKATGNGGGGKDGGGEPGIAGTSGAAGQLGSSGNSGASGASGGSAGDGSVGGGATAGGGRGSHGVSDGGPANAGGAGGTGSSLDGGSDAASTGSAGSIGGDPSAAVVSGTRLKAKWVTSPDGVKTYRRGVLYDSELKVDCAYGTAADGKLRCLPTGAFAVNAPVMYADPDCTQLVIWLTPDTPVGCTWKPAPYAFTGETTGHCVQTFPESYYPIEGTIIDNAGHFQKNGDTCTGVGVSYPGAIAVLLKAETPPTTFVEGTSTVAQ